ncbi:hypothetical protein A79_1448 [Vibrio parahaemolyticus AQ3810]|nr:hypothetical protein A79_1448 [Vibrio parahaemolyticus AQ3810]
MEFESGKIESASCLNNCRQLWLFKQHPQDSLRETLWGCMVK